MEKHLFNNLAELLLPLNDQLKELNSKLMKVSQKAEWAVGIAETTNKRVKKLQTELIALSEKLLLLGINCRQLNIKIHGFPEKREENGNLQSCIALWLAKERKLEEDVTPIITKTYKIGVANSSTTKGPRDIIISVMDQELRLELCN